MPEIVTKREKQDVSSTWTKEETRVKFDVLSANEVSTFIAGEDLIHVLAFSNALKVGRAFHEGAKFGLGAACISLPFRHLVDHAGDLTQYVDEFNYDKENPFDLRPSLALVPERNGYRTLLYYSIKDECLCLHRQWKPDADFLSKIASGAIKWTLQDPDRDPKNWQ